MRMSHQTAAVKSRAVNLPTWFELLAVILTAADCLCPPLHCFWQTLQEFAPLQASGSSYRCSHFAPPHTHTPGRSVRMWPRCVLLLYLSGCPTCVPEPVWVSGPGAERHLPEENKHDSLRWRHLPFESQRGCLNSCQWRGPARAPVPGAPLVEQQRADGREMRGGSTSAGFETAGKSSRTVKKIIFNLTALNLNTLWLRTSE